jgi:hypothetical protein
MKYHMFQVTGGISREICFLEVAPLGGKIGLSDFGIESNGQSDQFTDIMIMLANEFYLHG